MEEISPSDKVEVIDSTSMPSTVDDSIPIEYADKVTCAVEAMRRAYVARVKCALNHKKNVAKKRTVAAKNAKKMRKAQRRRRK